tara:strand:- start:3069 stop:3863 length:795 start_codon:yes stop_codon:yes gene_type:complete
MAKYIKSSYKIYFFAILLSTFLHSQTYNNCSVCLEKLGKHYLIDVWGNKFHKKHANEGHYCNSCSRLISEALTHGGYKINDGRYVCSLCYPNLVYHDYHIENSRQKVLEQLNNVGFKNLPNNIPIILLNQTELLELSNSKYHKNLKGFTSIDQNPNKNYNDYKIYILKNLHNIEFDAVLAHEYLHIWQSIHNIYWTDQQSEGLCNLGSELIYNNYNNSFSKILNNNMIKNDDPIYGEGYRKIKRIKDEVGWDGLIKKIAANYSY